MIGKVRELVKENVKMVSNQKEKENGNSNGQNIVGSRNLKKKERKKVSGYVDKLENKTEKKGHKNNFTEIVDERNAEKMVITTPRQKPSKRNPDKQNDQIKYKALATCNDSFISKRCRPV